MGQVVIPRADANPRGPKWAVTPGGWDTHAHVFGPRSRFPIGKERPYTSPDQVAADYLAMLDAIGLSHGVLVQPSVYGQDNACLLDALGSNPGRLYGVIDLDVLAVSDSVIEDLWNVGVRGVRVRPAGHDRGWLADVAGRLHGTSWHLDLLIENVGDVADLAHMLRGVPVDMVIEAMGNPRAGQSVAEPGFQSLLDLLRDGTCWVKLSHAYHIDPDGVPYPATIPFARAIVQAAPHRAVWGSDWPHPMRANRMPNDGDLIDLLLPWAGSVDLANQILCENPRVLYRPKPSERHRS